MVGLGMVFIAISLLSALQLARGRLYDARLLLRMWTWLIPAPFVAVLTGWFVTEVGRQPWMIQGLMRLDEAVTPSATGWMVLATLVGYVAVYAVVFTSGVYYLRKVILAGPDPMEQAEEEGGRPKRPWSAVPTGLDDRPQPTGA